MDEACLFIQARLEDGELASLQAPPFPGQGSAQDDDEDQIDRQHEFESEFHECFLGMNRTTNLISR